MISAAAELVNARDLLFEWTRRILQARYQQSLLGWFWAFVQPAAQAAIFTIIFTRLVPIDTGATPYAAFAYVATASWAFLVSSLTDMTTSLVDNMSLVNKVYFPRETLPLACMLARLVDLAIAALLFVGIAVYFKVPFFPAGLLMLPVVLLVQVTLVAGLGLASAALNVFARDVRPLVVLVTQIWMYASPVFYPVEAVPPAYRGFYRLNPMVGILEGYRDLLLRERLPGYDFLVSAIVAVGVFGFGYWFFKRVEFKFADIV